MSGFTLKWIALITMVVDHTGALLFPGVPLFRIIGRISFPLYGLLLVQGFTHTSSLKKYAGRLALFAVLSEPCYQYFHSGTITLFALKNVFFELLLGIAALYCVRRGKEQRWFYLGAAGAVVLAQVLHLMYGGYGILLMLGFYLCKEVKWAVIPLLAVLSFLYCWNTGTTTQLWAVLAAVPMLLYNGRRGQQFPKYVFYAFYPVHLVLLRFLFMIGEMAL